MTADRGITVTIKSGKEYDKSWEVFHGSPAEVREDMLAYYGISANDVTKLTTHELQVLIAAQVQVETVADIRAILHGEESVEPVNDEVKQARPVVETAEELLTAVQNAPSDDALTELWYLRKHLFDSKIIAAAKKRREELEGSK